VYGQADNKRNKAGRIIRPAFIFFTFRSVPDMMRLQKGHKKTAVKTTVFIFISV
jgi:hypothetical protein